MAKYPVTQKQWKSVMGNNPSHFKGGRLPVEYVTWFDCMRFCRKTGLSLPTEEQWEYACRAGSTGAYAGSGNLAEMGWNDRHIDSTQPVGKKRPNAWGLYDMHGNVWEWCADWYDSGYFAKSPATDPEGPDSGKDRVLRGGGYWYGRQDCRSSARGRGIPGGRNRRFGFRPVLRQD